MVCLYLEYLFGLWLYVFLRSLAKPLGLDFHKHQLCFLQKKAISKKIANILSPFLLSHIS